MKKIIVASVLALAVFIAFAPFSNAEMAKEGSAEGKAYYTVMVNVLPLEKGRAQLNYTAHTINSFADKDSPFYNTTGKCLGSLHVVKGEFNESGSCVLIRRGGDKIFITYKAKRKPGGTIKGTITITGGTGKCAGIQGGGEFTRYSLPRLEEAVHMSYSELKFNWKMP